MTLHAYAHAFPQNRAGMLVGPQTVPTDYRGHMDVLDSAQDAHTAFRRTGQGGWWVATKHREGGASRQTLTASGWIYEI
jgi:hypothetical protein